MGYTVFQKDGHDNVYIAGTFADSLSIGSIMLTAPVPNMPQSRIPYLTLPPLAYGVYILKLQRADGVNCLRLVVKR